MREELENQLRRFGRYHDSVQDPVDMTEALEGRAGKGAIRVSGAAQGRAMAQPPRRWSAWASASVAFAGVLLLGGVMGLLWAGTGSDGDVSSAPTPSPTLAAPSEPTSDTPGEGAPAGAWNPILSATVAGPAPRAASCPEGADPNTAGPVEQPRPWGAQWSNQAAVFDLLADKAIFVDERGDTWAFDVCTNTWQQAVSDGPTPWGRDTWAGELVYDVDSDVTVSFAGDVVSVYDANTNTWARIQQSGAYDGGMYGAVYDPGSGLIVVQTDLGLAAYDVDTDTWTPLRKYDPEVGVDGRQCGSYLIGYIADTDQFAFVSYASDCGVLIDLRTSATTVIDIPFDDLFAPFGRLYYATGPGMPTLMDDSMICQLEPATLEWACADLADGPGLFTESSVGAGLLAAIVEDPIHNRTVLIYGYGPGFNGKRFYDVNDIWAIDSDTTEWTLLLERSGSMTTERTTDNRP